MTTLHRDRMLAAAGHRAPGTRALRRRWLAAWAGLAVLGVTNGVARVALYEEATGDRLGHQISTFTLIALVAGYAWALQRVWPLASRQVALEVGAAWAAMTLAFEFGFGHYVAGTAWSELLADYNLLEGRLWVLVPAFIAVAPALARRLAAGRG